MFIFVHFGPHGKLVLWSSFSNYVIKKDQCDRRRLLEKTKLHVHYIMKRVIRSTKKNKALETHTMDY